MGLTKLKMKCPRLLSFLFGLVTGSVPCGCKIMVYGVFLVVSWGLALAKGCFTSWPLAPPLSSKTSKDELSPSQSAALLLQLEKDNILIPGWESLGKPVSMRLGRDAYKRWILSVAQHSDSILALWSISLWFFKKLCSTLVHISSPKK